MTSGALTYRTRQWRTGAIIFVVVTATLAAAYFWLLAREYAVLVSDIRLEEASAIIDDLKKEDVPYEIRNGGSTILVPSNQLDTVRLRLSGSELPLKGAVGFELFNQSDMGLTDFAQKVNYQRALQGEIARTIMSMDGIAYARVHVALPERSLFRTTRSEPRAAVALTPKRGVQINTDRIAGIQRLVAATVPDLAIDQVAVLDEEGDLLTPQFTDVEAVASSESALESNYHDRVARVVAEVAPTAHVGIKVTVVPIRGAAVDPRSGAVQVNSPRNHSLRIVIFERSDVGQVALKAIRAAVTSELALDNAAGDQLLFSPAVEDAQPIAAQPVAGERSSPVGTMDNADSPLMVDIARAWTIALWIMSAAAIVVSGMVWSRRRRTQRRALAGRIREHLLIVNGTADAA